MRKLLVVSLLCSALLSFCGHTASAHVVEGHPVAQSAERALERLETWEETSRPSAYVGYFTALLGASQAVSEELDAEVAGSLLLAWTTSEPDRLTVTLAALAQVGNDWRYGSTDPARGLDCSGLTRYAWGRVGVKLAASSGRQLRQFPQASEPAPGDLFGWPGHVMMSLGLDNYVVQSTGREKGIVVAAATVGSLTHVRPPISHPEPRRSETPPTPGATPPVS